MRGYEPHEEGIVRPDPRAIGSLRQSRRMSRAELARRAGLAARETVGRLERARRPIRVRPRTILRLARALKVNPRDLVLRER